MCILMISSVKGVSSEKELLRKKMPSRKDVSCGKEVPTGKGVPSGKQGASRKLDALQIIRVHFENVCKFLERTNILLEMFNCWREREGAQGRKLVVSPRMHRTQFPWGDYQHASILEIRRDETHIKAKYFRKILNILHSLCRRVGREPPPRPSRVFVMVGKNRGKIPTLVMDVV